MTNERAIELLNRISDSQFDGQHGDERREALEMAVRALSGDGDTISRQQAIDIVRNRVKRFTTACVLAVTEIEQLPPAQPKRKKGKWNKDFTEPLGYKCSVCGKGNCKFNFCPNCGADMRGDIE